MQANIKNNQKFFYVLKISRTEKPRRNMTVKSKRVEIVINRGRRDNEKNFCVKQIEHRKQKAYGIQKFLKGNSWKIKSKLTGKQ